MDPHPRSQSVMHVRPQNTPSRASRILQKVTNFKGRIRLTGRKPVSKDDRDINNPYPPHSRSMDDGPGVKPYMSHPMLAMGNMLVEPYVPGAGDGEDSSSQSPSPSGSEFRRRVGVEGVPKTMERVQYSSGGLPTTTTTRSSRGPSIDGLPVGAGSPTPWHYNHKTHHPPPHSHAQPTQPIPSHVPEAAAPMQTPTPTVTKHRTTPSIIISDAPESPHHHYHINDDNNNNRPRSSSSSGAAKKAKPKIDTSGTGLSPARIFTRKASRSRLKDKDKGGDKDKDKGEDKDKDTYAVPSPHPNAIHGPAAPPELPPPLPLPVARPTPSATPTPTLTPAPMHTHTHTPAITPRSFTAAAAATATAPLPLSYRSASESAVTPASTSTPAAPGMPRTNTAPRLTLPTHSYRFSLTIPLLDQGGGSVGAAGARLSPSVILRPPPLPILNLPTLVSTTATPVSNGPTRAGLRGMPELLHDGMGNGRREEEDGVDAGGEGEGEGEGEEDMDDADDTEGGRSSSALSQVFEFGAESDMDGDGDGDGEGEGDMEGEEGRPSFSSGGSLDPRSALGLGGGKSKVKSKSKSKSKSKANSHSHSRSSSYTNMTMDGEVLALALPGPDTSRIDLSFLEHPPPPPPSSSSSSPRDRKGKGKAREDDRSQEHDEDEDEDVDTTRTPTARAPYGDYFSSRTRSSGLGLPRRTDSLQRGRGQAGGGGGGVAGVGAGAGQRTPRPEDALLLGGTGSRAPGPLQASMSLRGGEGVGVVMSTRPGMNKRASRSLIDIHAVARRERVEMMVRAEQEAAEEEERRRRRRSVRVSQVGLQMQRDVGAGDRGGRDEASMTAAMAMDGIHEAEDGGRDNDMHEGKDMHKDKDKGRVGEEGEPMDMATPVATHKRLSKAPPYETIAHGLRRRRSMPTFTESTDPPPYPAFLGPGVHPPSASGSIQPRDDEGQERLPPYSNGIYMRGIVPLKMEFVAAGVQAKDRKWRRVLCIVEGTALKIYRCPAVARGVSAFGEWWEKKVGVGDVSAPSFAGSSAGGGASAGPSQEEERERVPKLGEGGGDQTELVIRPSTPITPITPARTQPLLTGEHPYVPGQPPLPRTLPQSQPQPNPPATRSRLNLAVLLRPSKHGRSNSDASQGQARPRSSPRPSLNIPGSSAGQGRSSLSGRPGTPATSVSDSSHSHRVPSPSSSMVSSTAASSCQQQGPQLVTPDDPDPADLIRAYTMQNAESGLGNDYLKRRNVVRVRVEGEQFLLQARDVPDVVAWIEALQASANVALDLDERLMPKGPLFPRRRRRRNRRPPTDTVTQPPATEASRPATAGTTNVALTTGI